VLIQAVGLAVLAALSPTAVLVSAVFLGSANPRRTVLIYLAGAVAITVIMAIVLFAVLHAGHLQSSHQRQPRYGLRLGLGVIMLLAGAWLRRRGPRPPDPNRRNQGFLDRLLARPGGTTAFVVGLLVYSPSLAFIAAVQVIATARASMVDSVLAVVVVVIITVAFVWLPLITYLLAPDRTTRTLRGLNGLLRSNGFRLAVLALAIGGVALTIDGILGLTGVVS
jgi:Sap, sulfolipid-1-addressing protein